MGETRLAGVRMPYAELPGLVRAFVEAELGAAVVEVVPRTGGMSPAVAATVRAANGRTAFVKAVGSEIHPETPAHFRHERAVLQTLPPAPYRAGLQAAYDDGDWVALLLDDVDGRHPDWDDASDRAAVLEVVHQQSHELTPPLPHLPTVSNREGLQKHLARADAAAEVELAALPAWARSDLGALLDLAGLTLEHHRDESFCHWDIRHDNILIRHHDQQPTSVCAEPLNPPLPARPPRNLRCPLDLPIRPPQRGSPIREPPGPSHTSRFVRPNAGHPRRRSSERVTASPPVVPSVATRAVG